MKEGLCLGKGDEMPSFTFCTGHVCQEDEKAEYSLCRLAVLLLCRAV